MARNETLRPNVVRQLAKELKGLDETPPEGIKVIVNDEELTVIFAEIDGPAGTPYEYGTFGMKLCLSNDFPNSPPKGYFSTKIFHPNISNSGEICVNALKKDWNPTLGLRHVLVVIRCLLIEPFPESALNEQAGKMLLEDYDEYARLARLYTGIHALKPKNRAPTICQSTSALNVNRTVKPLLPPSSQLPSLTKASANVGVTVKDLPSLTKASANVGVRVKDDENTAPTPNQMTGGNQIIGGSKKVTVKKKKKVGGGLEEAANAEKKKIDARKKSLRRL